MPEERSEKSNHNNPKDKTPRVEAEGLVVVGGQPVGIAHAKLLGRPPTSQPHQTLINFLKSVLWPRDAGRRIAARGAACRTLAQRNSPAQTALRSRLPAR
jgi:hypothetical protein